jgi:hypothetical protein
MTYVNTAELLIHRRSMISTDHTSAGVALLLLNASLDPLSLRVEYVQYSPNSRYQLDSWPIPSCPSSNGSCTKTDNSYQVES